MISKVSSTQNDSVYISCGNLLHLEPLQAQGWTRTTLEVLCNLCGSVIQGLWACYNLWDVNLIIHKEKGPKLLRRWSPSCTFHTEQPICYLTVSALDFSNFLGFCFEVVFMGPLITIILWAIKTAFFFFKLEMSLHKEFQLCLTQNHIVTRNNTFSPLHVKPALTGLIDSRNLHILTFSISLEVQVRNSFSLAMGSSDELDWL